VYGKKYLVLKTLRLLAISFTYCKLFLTYSVKPYAEPNDTDCSIEVRKTPPVKNKIKILIVDDNKLIRESLHIFLSSRENICIIGEAENGEEAILMVGSNTPDIVIMDINMSPMNGFETSRKIAEQYPSIKIIGFSMHTELSYCRDFLKLGAKGYLVKIGQPSEIIEAIQEVNAGKIYICKELRKKFKHL
jgi:DNA-binding NarL/FixJ family response regulator